mgnify:CR=1 FL=1
MVTTTYPDEFLTAREVSKILGVHICTVYMLLQEGRLRGFKLRHTWRIRRDEFEMFTHKEEDINE